MPQTTLEAIRDDLADVSKKLDVEQTRQRRWAAIVVLVLLIGAGGLFETYSRTNDFDRALDAVQDSRIATCIDIQQAQTALAQRDEDIIEVAVDIAEESPDFAARIIDRLNTLPSADALDPVDCEELIRGE